MPEYSLTNNIAQNNIHIMKDLIMNCLDENKAEDILAIDLQNKSDIADYMIIANGLSKPHIYSLVNKISYKIKHDLKTSVSIEGMNQAKWILISFQNLIINIFDKETRDYYQLEKMWLL